MMIMRPINPSILNSSSLKSSPWTFSARVLTLAGTIVFLGGLGNNAGAQSSVAPTEPTAPAQFTPSSVKLPTDTSTPGERSPQLQLLQAPTSPAPLQDEGYILGAGDVINITVFDVPEYSGDFAVQADGTVNLPFFGLLNVKGLTLPQASILIRQSLASTLRRPIVTVNLAKSRPTKISITGEVTRPGVYTLETLTSLTTALQNADGVTQSANIEQIQVLRAASRVLGTEQRAIFNLKALLESGDLQQDIVLRDGDQVFIPTVAQVDPTSSQNLASATFAPISTQPLRIAVVGEVNRPGPYTLTSNGTVPRVSNAIQEAGGITQQANVQNIVLRRISPTGTETSIALNFWELLQTGDLSQDLPLQEGDTIVIPQAEDLSSAQIIRLSASSLSPAQITVNIVGEVVTPGAIQVAPNTPLNQAILAAGGLNNRASKGSVQLVRLNPDGTVLQQNISLDLTQALNTDNNPSLRSNDTIVVGRKGIVQAGDAIGTVLGSFLSPLTGVSSFIRLFGF